VWPVLDDAADLGRWASNTATTTIHNMYAPNPTRSDAHSQGVESPPAIFPEEIPVSTPVKTKTRSSVTAE
jgi:hypothetical protein